MQCTNPIRIKNPAVFSKNMESLLERSRKDYGLLVPCGKCLGCRIARTREWAMRIMLEKEVTGASCFITITYDNDHLPNDLSLRKRELQLFIKRFRKSVSPVKIKYFACGEYGDKFERPHYHLIILGWEPPIGDLTYVASSKGKKIYSSDTIAVSWPYGYNVAGTLTRDSAQYVTGYIRKKLNGPLGKEHYGSAQPPFQLQSAGIGFKWADNNLQSLIDEGGITVNGKTLGLPRYFVKKFQDLGRHDFGPLRKESAIAADESVKNFYEFESAMSEVEGLVSVKMARRSRAIKNDTKLLYKRQGVYEKNELFLKNISEKDLTTPDKNAILYEEYKARRKRNDKEE